MCNLIEKHLRWAASCVFLGKYRAVYVAAKNQIHEHKDLQFVPVSVCACVGVRRVNSQRNASNPIG